MFLSALQEDPNNFDIMTFQASAAVACMLTAPHLISLSLDVGTAK
jgi:hypothetical protein